MTVMMLLLSYFHHTCRKEENITWRNWLNATKHQSMVQCCWQYIETSFNVTGWMEQNRGGPTSIPVNPPEIYRRQNGRGTGFFSKYFDFPTSLLFYLCPTLISFTCHRSCINLPTDDTIIWNNPITLSLSLSLLRILVYVKIFIT